jgi:hypothetical protein
MSPCRCLKQVCWLLCRNVGCAGECEEGKVVSFLFGTVVDESSRLLVLFLLLLSCDVEVPTFGDFLEFVFGIVFSA